MEKARRTNSLKSGLGRGAIVAALILVIGAAVFGFTRLRGAAQRPAETGETAQTAKNRGGFEAGPGFILKDASGAEHPLSGLKGNVRVLHFWASWCPPCVEELSGFLKFPEQFQDWKLLVKFV